MHAHHEVSLWSSGSCHSKEHYCLAETPDPPGGKKITSIFTIIVIFFASVRIITQYTFKFWRTHDGLQGSWNAYRQEHIVGGYLDSLIHEKPPPPAVWWLWQAGAGWRLYAEIRRLPGWSWDLPCGGLGPHTCWGVGCLDGHSTGLAERIERGKSL